MPPGVPTLYTEKELFDERQLAELAWRGESSKSVSFKTAVQVVRVAEDGVTGASDPRKFGVAMAR